MQFPWQWSTTGTELMGSGRLIKRAAERQHFAWAVLLVGVSVPLHAEDWPQWRGPHRDGTVAMEEASWKPESPPKIVWRASVGKGFSSLAVVGGRVFTMGNTDDTDSIFCLDAETGKVQWKHSYPCPLTPLAYEGGPSATPAVDGQRVFTLSKAGHLFCLDATTGEVKWSKKFEPAPRKEKDYRVDWGYASSPLVLGDKLIVSVGWAGMALNKADGKLLWDNRPGRPGYSSPVPFTQDGRQCVAMLVARGVVAVEAERGKILWTIPWRTTWDQNAADVIISGTSLFVSTGHGVGCALFDVKTAPPQEQWRNKSMRNELSSSIFWKGSVYGFDRDRVVCMDWQRGNTRWTGPELGRGTLIIVNGYLILLGEQGQLAIAEASGEAYRPLGDPVPILSGRCWTAPAFAAGRLYVRNAAGDVACVDLR
jgi:outer membrane protein assembly factor BamB